MAFDHVMNRISNTEKGENIHQHEIELVRSDAAGILANSNDQLHRGMKSRHIQFMALGGAIGTGLFVGSGAILSAVGPLPLWLAYLGMTSIVYFVMNGLGEMVTYIPLRGISVPYLVSRFVDPSLAFAVGWNYLYAYGMLVASEVTAGAIVLDYWKTLTPVWITIILVVILLLNIIAVELFGEAEFWFASIKLITILGLITLGIVLMSGGGPKHEALGFRYWQSNSSGAINEYMTGGAAGRFLAFWYAFIKAGFAFITSPELIAVAAGETVAPRRNIPKAVRRFIWRLGIFYGISSLILGCIVPSTSPRLLSGSNDASASPWVIAIQDAGIGGFNHVINFTILTSAWSAGNAFLYSGSRILYSMSLTGQAPKFFSRTTSKGVPYLAVLATWAFGLLAYLNSSTNGATVFNWFSNISTISGFIAWLVVLVTYLRFRSAMSFRGIMPRLPFLTPLQPWGTWYSLAIISLLTLTNGFSVFIPSRWNFSDFIAAYITLPLFLALYLGHKVWFRTRFYIAKADIDVDTGVKEMDELEAMDEPPMAKNWVERIWLWLA